MRQEKKKRRLVLSSRHIGELKKLATDSLPQESCALLAGRMDNDHDFIVSEVIVTSNADRSQARFSIEAGELVDAYRKAESRGLDIVGIFHSHPAPAKPSGTDTKYMEINPVPWLILSTTDGGMGAFLLEGDLQELEIAEDS